jgi:RHS repeat-associated protein
VDGVAQRYVYDNSNRIAVLDAADNLITMLVYAPGLDDPLARDGQPGSGYYQANALGSVVAVTSAAAVQARYSYEPYGATTVQGADPNDLAFTSRESDDPDLLYYRSRYYDPQTGRFLSQDPIGFGGGENLYSYALGNPIQHSDPSGQYVGADDLALAGIGAVGGILGQGISDLINWKLSGLGDYGASAAGGALGVWSSEYLTPAGGAAAGAALRNVLHQEIKNYGTSCSFNFTDLGADVAFSGLTAGLASFLPDLPIPGVTSGRGSWSAVGNRILTQLGNGSITGVSAKTALKMIGAHEAKDFGQQAIEGGFERAKPLIPGAEGEECGCK